MYNNKRKSKEFVSICGKLRLRSHQLEREAAERKLLAECIYNPT